MPQIDFHILPDASASRRLDYACRLAGKAWRAGHGVLLLCPDQASGEQVDELLWLRPAESFIPHRLASSAGTAPVLIGWPGASGLNPGLSHQYPVLINLDTRIPAWYEGHARVIEVVNQDPQLLAALRSSFASYRERGYPAQIHRI